MSTFRCEFLGCKVNQYDAEKARRHLLERGLVETDRNASLLLLASCTVTSVAAGKGRRAIRSLLRRNPGARVAVLGCMTEEDRSFYQGLDAPVTVLPSARDEGFLASLEPALQELVPASVSPTAVPPVPRRTRAFLKVEDGCDLRCAFCIIPSVRGRARSRSPADVLHELRGRIDSGVREIVLTGVHLGHYGRRTADTLPGLLRSLVKVPGDWRLRLSSLEVSELSDEIVEILAAEAKIVPHLHLPLQSGSERILRAMRRPYSAREFLEASQRLRTRLADPAITTDVIVGFPGEEKADFGDTLRVMEEVEFSRVHVFPFSPRRGTDAELLEGRVHGLEVKERKDRLAQAAARLARSCRERRIGNRARVLIESRAENGCWSGYDERYFRTEILGSENTLSAGELVDVCMVSSDDAGLRALLVGSHPDSAEPVSEPVLA